MNTLLKLTVATLLVHLVSGGQIKGTLQDPDGKPAGGFVIKLMQRKQVPIGGAGARSSKFQEDGLEGFKTLKTVTTRTDGGFEFKDLPEGVYVLYGRKPSVGKLLERVSVSGNDTVTATAKLERE